MSQLGFRPLENLTQLKVGHVLFYLAIIPALQPEWIPHLQLNPTPDSGKYTNEF